MSDIDTFLEIYGIAAIFVVMLLKSIGLPIPVPADVIMLAAAARAADGKLSLWQAFIAILVALVAGSSIQYGLARGPGRGFLYRFGRYLGLTPARLDAASALVERGGPIGIALSIVTPGVRAASVAACGLAALPVRVFLPGMVLGSALFLSLHFFLGYVGGSLIGALVQSVPLPAIALLALLLVAGFAAWFVIRRRQQPDASEGDVLAEAFEAWHEATCPVCLVLGGASQIAGLPAEGNHAHGAVPR